VAVALFVMVVPNDNVEKAFYQLENPQSQIESYVLASVRGDGNKA
jgi:hypothetical protein